MALCLAVCSIGTDHVLMRRFPFGEIVLLLCCTSIIQVGSKQRNLCWFSSKLHGKKNSARTAKSSFLICQDSAALQGLSFGGLRSQSKVQSNIQQLDNIKGEEVLKSWKQLRKLALGDGIITATCTQQVVSNDTSSSTLYSSKTGNLGVGRESLGSVVGEIEAKKSGAAHFKFHLHQVLYGYGRSRGRKSLSEGGCQNYISIRSHT